MTPGDLTCCGSPMVYLEVFGVRRYSCSHRAHHPAIYVNLNTGEHVSDDNLRCQEQTTKEYQ